ncbi:MAG: hypothetical protein E6J90_19800 [Deltaproteobacteria bacterium]|nr:MAG: hypothetical protein E6J90_19800 [Deltaproteobacteria bacterium]
MRACLALVLAACASGTMAPPPPTEISVAITSPQPGAELVAAHPTIAVTGTVAATNPRGAVEAWVNGVRVDVVDGAFSAEVTPDVGINHIKLEAGDGASELVTRELDVMWAPAYLAPRAGETGFDATGALSLQLGQRFFDARLLGTALDRSTDPIVARDLASAIELILWHIDLAGLVTGGIHRGGGDTTIDITLPSVTPSDIVADARIVDSPAAVDLKIDLLGVFLAMHGSATLAGRTLAIDGGVTTDLHATARLTLGLAPDGTIAVHATGVTAGIGPLTPGFVGPNAEELDALLTLGSSNFRALIEGLLSELIPTFTDRLPPLLETVLGTAGKLLDNLQFTLDTGLGHPVMLQLDGRTGALDVAAGATSGHVTIRQDLAITTSGSPVHAASRGAPRVDASAADPVLDTSGVHLAVGLDFLNALLHALWNAGMLDGKLDSGLAANVTARLPPVVLPTPAASPCKIDGKRCDVVLELGQVELELPGFRHRVVPDPEDSRRPGLGDLGDAGDVHAVGDPVADRGRRVAQAVRRDRRPPDLRAAAARSRIAPAGRSRSRPGRRPARVPAPPAPQRRRRPARPRRRLRARHAAAPVAARRRGRHIRTRRSNCSVRLW